MENTSITITFADRVTAEAYKDALVTLLGLLRVEKQTPDSFITKTVEENKLDEHLQNLYSAISEATFFKRSTEVKA
jgi:hypothetical protein